MPDPPPPPKTKFAAGLLTLFGVLALFVAVADGLWFAPAGRKMEFRTERGYDESNGPDGYHFRFHITGSGPGADRALGRGVAALAGFGFLIFGTRLFLGRACTLMPAAGLAVLVGVGVGLASVQAARAGRATVGLPGMGLAFVLVLAACLLVVGRNEYITWRTVQNFPRGKPGPVRSIAGAVLLLYGLVVVGLAVYRTASWLEPVRGQRSFGLRAEVSASTGLEFLGKVMQPAAEKSGSFSPGPGYFLHPQAFAAGWGGVWLVVGLAVLSGRGSSPKFVGLLALAAGLVAAAFAGLSLFAALPWYAALPDGVFPGCAVLLPAGGLLLAGRSFNARPA